MSKRIESPCSKDCPDRSIEPNCHMSCESYLAFCAYLKKKSKDEHSELKEYMENHNRTRVMY